MTRICHALLMVVALAMVGGCSPSDRFSIKGDVDGDVTTNLRYSYYGNGALHVNVTAAIDGRFDFVGSSSVPCIITIYSNDFVPVCRLCASNGESLKCHIDLKNPYLSRVTGSDINEEYTAWLNDNAAQLAVATDTQRNDMVAQYVSQHPDNPVSSVLIATLYDASTEAGAVQADNLISSLGDKGRLPSVLEPFVNAIARAATPPEPVQSITYRITGDTVAYYNPTLHHVSMLVFSDEYSHRTDSILPTLRRLARNMPPRSAMVDISLDIDTFAWRRVMRADTATWAQGWLPGSVNARPLRHLNINRIPYYIVVDSTGRQIYRGTDIQAAAQMFK